MDVYAMLDYRCSLVQLNPNGNGSTSSNKKTIVVTMTTREVSGSHSWPLTALSDKAIRLSAVISLRHLIDRVVAGDLLGAACFLQVPPPEPGKQINLCFLSIVLSYDWVGILGLQLLPSPTRLKQLTNSSKTFSVILKFMIYSSKFVSHFIGRFERIPP